MDYPSFVWNYITSISNHDSWEYDRMEVITSLHFPNHHVMRLEKNGRLFFKYSTRKLVEMSKILSKVTGYSTKIK